MTREPNDLDRLVDEALRRIGPTTAYALASWIRGCGERMTEVQVYRSLRRLMARGCARHIRLGRRYAACAPRDGDVLALACRRCGRLRLVPEQAAHRRLRQLAVAHNVAADETIVEVVGVCSICEPQEEDGM